MGYGGKERILESALECMKGGKTSPSIKEIAKNAGVQESVIYRHYEDKQDLLFRALESEARSLDALFKDNLNGITEPMSRLSRFLWVWFDLLSKNEWFFRCLYFSGFSKQRFYRHEAFKTIERWWERVDMILKEGVRAGVFPPQMSVPVARDMIWGLMDMECLYALTVSPRQKVADKFGNCCFLIEKMLKEGTVSLREEADLRQRILNAVEKVVAIGESEKITTASIARMAKVAEGTIYNYFHDKEDLILASIQRRLELLAAMADEFFKRSTPISKLIRFIFYHFTVYSRYPFAVKTFVLKGIFSEKFYTSKAFEDYERFLSILDEIVAEGIREGVFHPGVNSDTLKRMLTGFFVRTAQMWFYRGKEAEAEIMSRFHTALTLVLRSVLADRKELPWMEKVQEDSFHSR